MNEQKTEEQTNLINLYLIGYIKCAGSVWRAAEISQYFFTFCAPGKILHSCGVNKKACSLNNRWEFELEICVIES